MAAKQVLVSTDDATYYLLPGNSGDLSRDGVNIDDTIFGQTYKSGQTGPITMAINAQAFYKGYPGYQALLKKPGTGTPSVGEAMSLVSGKTYQATNAAHRVWDRSVAVVVKDNAINQNANVLNVDFLFGRVTFVPGYTVVGPVTIDVTWLAQVTIGKFTGFTLGMKADAINNSDIPTMGGNGGYHTFTPGLKHMSLDLPTVFTAADLWWDQLDNRTEYIIEINPDGLGVAAGSVARGFFRLMTDKQQGAVGALEEEILSFVLAVPYSNIIVGTQGLAYPFGWLHAAASPMPMAVQKTLTQMLSDTSMFVKYLPDGGTTALAGMKAAAVATDVTLKAGMETMNEFQCGFQLSGAPTAV
jgi:hypothetical protein